MNDIMRNLIRQNLQKHQQSGWSPTAGTSVGGQTFTGSGWQDAGNPNDPNQLSSWATGVAGDNANRQLYDTDTLNRLKEIFGPLFQQQTQGFTDKYNQALNSQTGQAVNQAGAMAAFRGLNPSSYTQSAARGVRQSLSPNYFSGLSDMMTGQTGSLIGATADSSRFQSQNALAYAQMLMNQAQQAQQTWDQPTFWDYLLGGVTSSLPFLGSLFGTGGADSSGAGNMMNRSAVGNMKG